MFLLDCSECSKGEEEEEAEKEEEAVEEVGKEEEGYSVILAARKQRSTFNP